MVRPYYTVSLTGKNDHRDADHSDTETLMITGAHSILYSNQPKADREFLKNIMGLPHVDVGGGWLIFGLPPAELAVHPAEVSGKQEFYFICDDVEAFTSEMQKHSVTCSAIHEEPWGKLVDITLPGGGQLGVYQALHERPASN